MGSSRFIFSRRLVGGMLGVLVAFAVSGCTFSGYLARTAIDYNQSIETSSNALILTNVLRASEHQPLHFSSISILRGSIIATAGASVTTPFGGNAVTDAFSTDPSLFVTVSPTADIVPLNTQEFMRGLPTETSFGTFMYYWNSGLSPKVLLNLLVAKIRGDGKEVVNDPESPEDFERFQQFVRCAMEEKFAPYEKPGELDFGPPILFKPDPKNPAAATELIKGLTALVAAQGEGDLTVDWDSEQEAYRLRKVYATRSFGRPKSTKSCPVGNASARSLRLSSGPPVEPAFRAGPRGLESSRIPRPRRNSGPAQPSPPEPEFVLRSADAILHYLGALVRRSSEVSSSAIFRIREGRPAVGASTMAVRYRGRVFHVEPSDSDSLRTLQVVTQLLSINTSAQDLPTTPSVIRVGP